MGQELLSIYQLEKKRFLWVIGITVAMILAFHYFEFPYGDVQPLVFSAKKIPTLDSIRFQAADPPSESQIFNNVTNLNQANSTGENALEIVDETRTSEGKDTISRTGFISEPGRVSNKSLGFDETDESSTVESVGISNNGSVTEQVGNLVLSSYNNTISRSPSHAITSTYLAPPLSPTKVSLNITPPTSSNDYEETDSEEDERFRPLKDDVNILANNSSINSVPKETKDSQIPVPEVTTISEMNELLLQNYASYRSMRPRWSSAVDQELLQARSEIENAPIVNDVVNLYAPVFRNISMFKRYALIVVMHLREENFYSRNLQMSYELMEKTLKVYVYREGAKPIMHSPYLLGIYASEGWFMKQMEASKQFVTKDPKKAHLFYLPFSSRMLEETLYVQNSHSTRNLVQYLKNYVDMIATKHHFWNRTGGADHFLVACHDWAPKETKRHMAKCLRSLCNADVKEGFVLGKDVSLPETYVRNAQRPTRNIGGNQVSRRKTLAFFAGGMHGYVRPILLQHWENKDPDMKIFGILPKSKGNRNYIQYMKSSKYCICAKGYEVNSPRVVEAIFYECVPVIISDNFVPPFFEVLNWESFAVFVLEKDIPNLKSILLSIPQKRYLQMQMRVKRVQQHFLWHRTPVKFLCQAETKRLVSFVGITVVIVLMVQYSELPNSKFISSLTTKITTFTTDASSVNSKVEGNNMHLNGSNSISPQASLSGFHNDRDSITAPALEKAKGLNNVVNFTTRNDGSPMGSVQGKENNLTTQGAAPPRPMVPLLNRTSLDSQTDSVKSTATGPVYKDGNSGSLQGSSNLTFNNGKPVTAKNSKKRPSKVVSMSEMNLLLQHNHASKLVKPARSSAVDLEILHVKSEILNAPIIMNDTRLYQPLYRNVSMFRRSYELMEKMLKVYIYQDGDRPIFHEPLLDGIYASEGWFMKLMEANKQFVTGDPGKAHLFYIPFSSRLLQLTLYVRNSHKRSNLIEYMKNYVDMIAGKYPFWNRTSGADHFVVACHDWAPAETRGRMLSCIRALCNADIEVGFKIGKDVSLPETYIRSIENPIKNIGGNPPSQRPILAFFAGGLHGYVRPVLLKHWENKEPDMKITGPLPHVRGNRNYIELMKSSKFCICARGHEVNSPRVVESIFHECIPVIISDNFIPPFFEILNWESFAVFVTENDIPNLRNILLSISEQRYLEMYNRVKKVQEHFIWHAEPVKRTIPLRQF
ncbi:putative glycosyltransferase, partial [Mucuna pruriens]